MVHEFVERHGLRRDPATLVLDLTSEVGELAKEVLKGSEYGSRPFAPRPETPGEVGDVLYSTLALADALGLDADQLLRDTLAKYERRLGRAGSAGSEAERT